MLYLSNEIPLEKFGSSSKYVLPLFSNGMKFLIVYATNSGGTKEVAELIEKDCRAAGHAVVVKSAEYTEPADLQGYDCVLLGSCTWEHFVQKKHFEGGLQEHMAALRDKLKGADLSGKKFALFGLGDSSYTNFCSAANHLEALVKQTHGTQVAATLRVDGYFYDLPKNRALIRDWTKQFLKAVAA